MCHYRRETIRNVVLVRLLLVCRELLRVHDLLSGLPVLGAGGNYSGIAVHSALTEFARTDAKNDSFIAMYCSFNKNNALISRSPYSCRDADHAGLTKRERASS